MPRSWMLVLVCIACSACGGSTEDSNPPGNNVVAPTSLSYPATQPYVAGTAIVPLMPTVSGSVDTFSVAPSLPAGLSLDAASGRVSGTPTTATPQTTYVISATNAGGSTTYSLSITVTPMPVVTSIALVSNTNVVIADGNSSPTLVKSFVDQFGSSMSPTSVPHELLVNGVPYSQDSFRTSTPGDYALVVRSGSVQSNPITLRARPNTVYSTITIPIVFHIAHFGEPAGSGANLSMARIGQILSIINRGFSNQAGSIDPNAVDTNVRFRLALFNPSGVALTEPGIHRVDARPFDNGGGFNVPTDVPNDGSLGPNESWKMQGQNYWNPRWYVNFWIGQSTEGRGSAALPRVYANTPLAGLETVPVFCLTAPPQPGCDPWVEDFQSFFLDVDIVDSAAVHELGHVLGLLHPQSYGTCGAGDYVTDTFNYIADVVGNPACPGNLGTRVSNTFMDYAGAFNTFTYEQRDRIQFVLRNGRWMKDLPFSTQ